MTPDNFFRRLVEPTLYAMAEPGVAIPITDAARVLMMAIAGQESRWSARQQVQGPARGYWQFERGGGVAGVLTHPATALKLRSICGAEDIPTDYDTVYEAIAWHDRLACSMARLLLWSDPKTLPAVGDKDGAWDLYLRTWRPGMPHRESWSGVYDQSLAAIGRTA